MRSGTAVRLWVTVCALIGFGVARSALAAQQTFNINANGAKEVTAGGVPNQGDPDGTAIGTLTLDNVTGQAIINITLANIDTTTLSGHHVHQAPFNTTGNIVLDFGDPDNIRTGNLLSGTIGGLSTTTINNVFANPSGFYYNIHNTPFSGGAVRDQLPEPGVALLVGIGAIGLMRRRGRKA
jgi:hypothetical protein